MKSIIITILVCLLVLSFCIYQVDKESREPQKLTLISEIDGCKLYLVTPAHVYWSTCEGQTQWNEHSVRRTVTKQVITKKIKSNE